MITTTAKKSARSTKKTAISEALDKADAKSKELAKAAQAKGGAKSAEKAEAPKEPLVVSRALTPAGDLGIDRLPELYSNPNDSKDLALAGISSRFVLGRTAKGRLNGKVEHINDFCLRRTIDDANPHGRAFSDKHQAKLFKDHADWGKLNVVTKDEAKALGKELDAIRDAFYAEIKPAVIAMQMRPDAEVRQMKLRETVHGITMTTSTVIKRPVTQKETQLEAENRKLKAELAAIQGLVPKKLAAQAHAKAVQEEKSIDVSAVVSAPAPVSPESPESVAAAQPVVPAATAPVAE